MWSSGRRVLQDLLVLPAALRSFSLTAAQNTVVVERWWQVPLSKVGSPPRLHPRRHRIYKLVEDTKHLPQEKMELILTQTVPKLGGRGDTVFVKKSIGRNKLLPQGLAVYPSPENKQMFAEELRLLREGKPEERVQTRTGQLTVEFLKRSHLKINQMPSDEFQVHKEVVCRQFLKKLGVVVPPNALSLPFDSVKEVGDFWCEVTVNGIDTVRIPLSVVPFEDQSASYKRQLKAQKLQLEAEEVLEPTDEEGATAQAVFDAAVEAEEVSEPAGEKEATAQAVSDAAVEAEEVSEPAGEKGATAQAVSDAAVEAEEVSEPAGEEEATAQAVSDAAVEAEAVKDSESQVSKDSASAAEETAANTPTSQDTTAPPSDSPKKD